MFVSDRRRRTEMEVNMKKIGIMTFHWASNHGAILQAYALQTYLFLVTGGGVYG